MHKCHNFKCYKWLKPVLIFVATNKITVLSIGRGRFLLNPLLFDENGLIRVNIKSLQTKV